MFVFSRSPKVVLEQCKENLKIIWFWFEEFVSLHSDFYDEVHESDGNEENQIEEETAQEPLVRKSTRVTFGNKPDRYSSFK